MFITEYYWRSYNGTVPNDAILGGMDKNGQPIYIGQAPYMWTAGNIPGSIYVGRREVVIAALTLEIRASKNVKVSKGIINFNILLEVIMVQYVSSKYIFALNVRTTNFLASTYLSSLNINSYIQKLWVCIFCRFFSILLFSSPDIYYSFFKKSLTHSTSYNHIIISK